MILNEELYDLDDNYDTVWQLVDIKQVEDSDGLLTDYAWYKNEDGTKHIFMFGDSDLYEPDEDYADWETDTFERAQEWFDSYNGFEDEDLDESIVSEKFGVVFKDSEIFEFLDICKEIGVLNVRDIERLLKDFIEPGETPLQAIKRYKAELGDDFEIKESYDDYDPTDGWTEDDVKLHKNTDWAARNYRELEVPEDSFEDEAVLYGDDGVHRAKTKFIKYIRPNPIYPPYYAPEKDPFKNTVGRMYGGRKHGSYDIHDRYESQAVYDRLSEDVQKYIIVAITKDGQRQFYKDGEWVDDIENSTKFTDHGEALRIWHNIDKSQFKRVFVPNY